MRKSPSFILRKPSSIYHQQRNSSRSKNYREADILRHHRAMMTETGERGCARAQIVKHQISPGKTYRLCHQINDNALCDHYPLRSGSAPPGCFTIVTWKSSINLCDNFQRQQCISHPSQTSFGYVSASRSAHLSASGQEDSI